MSSKLRTAIMKAIDTLRNRRVRPDRERIVEIVTKNSTISTTREEVLKELSRAVEEEAVIKVRYKEGFSYRNPNKSSTKGTVVKDSDGTPAELSFAISQTLRKVFSTSTSDVASPPVIVAMSTFIATLRFDFPDIDVQDDHVYDAIEEEVALGNCVRLENGDIAPPIVSGQNSNKGNPSPTTLGDEKGVKGDQMKRNAIEIGDGGDSQSTPSEERSSSQRSSKRQRVKKNLDPDFLDPMELNSTFTKNRTVRSSSSTPMLLPSTVAVDSALPVIPKTLSMIDRRSREYKESLLKCIRCNRKGAPDSDITLDILVMLRSLKWKCNNCVLNGRSFCCFCNEAGADFTCASCIDHGKPLAKCYLFHYKCLFNYPKYEPGKFFCVKCFDGDLDDANDNEDDSPDDEEHIKEVEEYKDAVSKIVISSVGKSNGHAFPIGDGIEGPSKFVLTNGSQSQAQSQSQASSSTHSQEVTKGPSVQSAPSPFATRMPDTWTVDEVVEFLRTRGFEQESNIFRDQEIDGKSLLLLKREDVLKGMGMKVGPALKIFCYITHLQNSFLVTSSTTANSH